MEKKVTIIMPVHNNAIFLRESMDSILNQTYKNFEFLILNDGSDELEVKEILEKYSKKDPRVKIFETKKVGVTRALNLLLGISQGEYIFRQDSDDISDLERIKIQVNFLDNNLEVGAVCSVSDHIDENSEIIGQSEFVDNLKEKLKHENPVIHGSVAFRARILEDLGFYDDKLPICQSYEMWRRIDKFSQICMLPEKLYSIRKYPMSYTAINDHLNVLTRKIIQETHIDDFKRLRNYSFYKKNSRAILSVSR